MEELIRSPAYFAIITGPVLDNRELAANAKILYASITSMTDSKGYCWASNQYLADRFGWGERTVTRLIAQLQRLGFIRTVMVLNEQTRKMERRIYIGNYAAEGVAKIGDPCQNWRGGVAKNGDTYYMLNNKLDNTPLNPPQGGTARAVAKEPKKPQLGCQIDSRHFGPGIGPMSEMRTGRAPSGHGTGSSRMRS